jgi:hypothetical protein
MNCTGCNAPLIPEARFCRNCGMPVSPAIAQPATTNQAQANQREIGDSPTILPPSWQSQQPAPVQPQYTPPQAYQPTVAVSPNAGSMPSTGAPFVSFPPPTRRRKNRFMQVLLIVLAALLIMALLLAGGWFVVLRPYMHGIAQNEIDGVFSSTISQINPIDGLLISASRGPMVITEANANSFIAANTSDPIQQMHMTITPAGLKIEFQTYGFTSTITAVPQVVNGQLVMTNVSVQGIASLIISPDELTTTLNAHLQDVSAALHKSIASVTLKEGEMDVQLR